MTLFGGPVMTTQERGPEDEDKQPEGGEDGGEDGGENSGEGDGE